MEQPELPISPSGSPARDALPDGDLHRSPAEVEVARTRSVRMGQFDEVRLFQDGEESAGDVPVELAVVNSRDPAGRGCQNGESAIHPPKVGHVPIGALMAVVALAATSIVADAGPGLPVHVVVDHPVPAGDPAERQDEADARLGHRC